MKVIRQFFSALLAKGAGGWLIKFGPKELNIIIKGLTGYNEV